MVGTDVSPTIAAAVELIARHHSQPLALRGGVAQDQVLIFDGDDYIGRPTNLAARLCQAARPGELLAVGYSAALTAKQVDRREDSNTPTTRAHSVRLNLAVGCWRASFRHGERPDESDRTSHDEQHERWSVNRCRTGMARPVCQTCRATSRVVGTLVTHKLTLKPVDERGARWTRVDSRDTSTRPDGH